jgi:hypothetical protein
MRLFWENHADAAAVEFDVIGLAQLCGCGAEVR